METIMQPFIIIYHIVSKVLSFPSKLIKKSTDSIQEKIEDKKIQESKNKDTK